MDCEEVKILINKNHLPCCEKCHHEFLKNGAHLMVKINNLKYKVCCAVRQTVKEIQK